jgi:hypothetical protein
MSILDWSDPEEMVGLLAEYIRDELLEERHDRRWDLWHREQTSPAPKRSPVCVASMTRNPPSLPPTQFSSTLATAFMSWSASGNSRQSVRLGSNPERGKYAARYAEGTNVVSSPPTLPRYSPTRSP